MNNELNTQNMTNVKMNSIKVKYEDLVLTDTDTDTDLDTDSNLQIDKKSNNSVFKNIRNNQLINKKSYSKKYKKINNKIFRIENFLKKIYNKVYNINKKTFIRTSLFKENKYSNIFVKNSINFLETNYVKIVNNRINYINKNNKQKYNFENVYVISFSFNKNYNKIIEIYKKILLDLNDDYKLLFANPIFDFDITNNLDLQTISYFKNKVNYKKRILDEYFKQKINYFQYINIITCVIYNLVGCIGILLISIYYENIKNYFNLISLKQHN